MDQSDQFSTNRRSSNRSTRRGSLSEYKEGGGVGVGEYDSFEDEFDNDQSVISTPPPNTPKKQRSSVTDESRSTSAGDQKHSINFSMTREAFIHDLYSFMKSRGQPITKLPSLGYQELDLYLLYQLVIARGGMDDVTRKQEWKLVYQDLGIPTMSTSASYNTRTNYKKYLYLYELEHCDFPDKNRPKDAKPKYQIGAFIRIVSSVFEGQVFYARILKYRFKEGKNSYYVHYNGWSNSHDEWMREDVLDPLLSTERDDPESLINPPPSRSSKSNHLIFDPNVSEKIISNLVSSQKSPKNYQNPLSPASPNSNKKNRKTAALGSSMASYYDSYSSGGTSSTSEEEEAANELLAGMERYAANQRNNYYYPQQPAYKPVEVLRYPMRSDPGEDIAKILEEKRGRPHEQDLIHRNRLHTHVLMGKFYEESDRERKIVAELLKSVKTKIQSEEQHKDVSLEDPIGNNKKQNTPRNSTISKDSSLNDPRNLHDIQESLVSLQASLLATQNSYKHTMKALKKHHDVHVLPPAPVQTKKNIIGTRRGGERA